MSNHCPASFAFFFFSAQNFCGTQPFHSEISTAPIFEPLPTPLNSFKTKPKFISERKKIFFSHLKTNFIVCFATNLYKLCNCCSDFKMKNKRIWTTRRVARDWMSYCIFIERLELFWTSVLFSCLKNFHALFPRTQLSRW